MKKTSAAQLRDVLERARALAAASPFTAWPEEPLLRLARTARVVTYRRGAVILLGLYRLIRKN